MSLAACAQMVERADPDRFLATMAAPARARARLFPIYAFNIEVARAPWVTQEWMIAEMRLQWWRDALDDMEAGAPRGHEVALALAGVMEGQSAEPLRALIEARRWDIYRDPFEDMAAFDAYIDATSGNLLWVAAQALGAGGAQEPGVRDLAYGAGVANWLCAIPALTASGRIPLVDGRPEAVAALAQGARARLAAGRRGRYGAAAAALRSTWRADGILRAAIADPARVAQGTLAGSEAGRRLGLMWRAALGRV